MLKINFKPKYILNQVCGGADTVLLNPFCRDNCTEPYIKLKNKCEELGYSFEETKHQRLEDCCWFIFWDYTSVRPMNRLKAKIKRYSYRHLYREIKAANLQHKTALFLFEPPSVCPENFDPILHDDFPIIFTWDPTLVDDKKYFKIFLPNPTNFGEVTNIPFSKKKLLVNISSYKFSSHPKELYSETRKTIRFFEEHCSHEFDLYGLLWNRNLKQHLMQLHSTSQLRREHYPSYKGVAGNKWDVYPKYKFALCYENISHPGYISLKIFDCLRSGCVPIYLGAPEISDYVDSKAFIDRRDFKTLEDMVKFLRSINNNEYQKYIEAGKIYQESAKFKLFLSENFVNTIVHTLKLNK